MISIRKLIELLNNVQTRTQGNDHFFIYYDQISYCIKNFSNIQGGEKIILKLDEARRDLIELKDQVNNTIRKIDTIILNIQTK